MKLGEQAGVPVFQAGTSSSPADIAAQGIAAAQAQGCDCVIVDTAGRTQVDADMMAELQAVKARTGAVETLLVVDAMTGQEAASLSAAFNESVGITGAVLTKMDGDARGGAVYAGCHRPLRHRRQPGPHPFGDTGTGWAGRFAGRPGGIARRRSGL